MTKTENEIGKRPERSWEEARN